MEYKEFEEKFPADEDCINHYIKIRYNGTLVCPNCNSTTKVYRFKKRPRFCQCKKCNKTFSVFRDTVFEKSRTSLKTWFYLIRLSLNSEKVMPALQIKRETGLTYKCAWDLRRKIRKAMGNPEIQALRGNL